MKEKTKSATARPRIRNPELTRARLLQATVELLAQKGADGLSIKEAASLAKVSRGVAYQHFEHREHLLREAKQWMTERVLESIQQNDASSADDILLHTTRLILQNRDAATLLVSDGIAGRDLAPDHPITQMIQLSLKSMQETGQARADIDVEILSYIFLGMTSTLVMLSRLPDTNADELARRFANELSNFMNKGIFSPGSSA